MEAQAAHDEGKRWQVSMLADIHLRQSQRGSQQSLPNDPSPSDMHSSPRAGTSREPQIINCSICSSSNASSTSSDSGSETGKPRRSGRAAKKSFKATDNSQQRREGVGSSASTAQRRAGSACPKSSRHFCDTRFTPSLSSPLFAHLLLISHLCQRL